MSSMEQAYNSRIGRATLPDRSPLNYASTCQRCLSSGGSVGPAICLTCPSPNADRPVTWRVDSVLVRPDTERCDTDRTARARSSTDGQPSNDQAYDQTFSRITSQ